MKLAELPIPSTLRADLDARGFVDATPVQAALVAPEHQAGDLLVSSQTGSGKTVAFGLALAPLLLDDVTAKARRGAEPRALIVAPTRELALQVARELAWLYRSAGARVATCVGGMDIRREQRALDAGAEIVVGTPGRLCDHLTRDSLRLGGLAAVVLDEGDEMLDMGFKEELGTILAAAPAERRTLMFSATMPREMEALARKFTTSPRRISATAPSAQHQDIATFVHFVAPREREHAVVNVLRFHEAPAALVFCATRDAVAHLHASLVERGFQAVCLSGELSQAERNRAIGAVREGRARVLVGTDVAARGLDLPAVGLVIHADVPHDAEVLQHRSGRTGRAGKKGTAVLLVPFARRRAVERMLQVAGTKPRVTPAPSPEQIRALDRERFSRDLLALAGELDADDLEAGRALLAQLPAESVAAVLIKTLRRNLPAAEELVESGGATGRAAARESRDTRDPRDGRDPRARGGGPRRHVDDEGGVWFRVNVGREQRADPKWLLPMLCRRGGITKRELGTMEIGRRETRFAIDPRAAERFEVAAARPDKQDPKIRIERMERR